MQLYRREAGLMQRLHDAAPGNALWTQRYAFSLWHQAEQQLELGQLDEARANFAAAEGLLQSIIKQDPSNRSWQSALYTVQFKLVDVVPASPASKLAALQALQAKFTGLIELEPKKLNLQRLRALAEARHARLLWDAQQRAEARRELTQAIDALEGIQRAAPSDSQIRKSVIETLFSLVEFDNAEHDTPHAQASCRKLETLLDASSLPDQRFQRRSSEAYAKQCSPPASPTRKESI